MSVHIRLVMEQIFLFYLLGLCIYGVYSDVFINIYIWIYYTLTIVFMLNSQNDKCTPVIFWRMSVYLYIFAHAHTHAHTHSHTNCRSCSTHRGVLQTDRWSCLSYGGVWLLTWSLRDCGRPWGVPCPRRPLKTSSWSLSGSISYSSSACKSSCSPLTINSYHHFTLSFVL